MLDSITVSTLTTIFAFIAPGYFANRVYNSIYAHKSAETTELLISSAVYSLPIVVVCNLIVAGLNAYFHLSIHFDVTRPKFVLMLVTAGLIVGFVLAKLRQLPLISRSMARVGFYSPGNDFLKDVLVRDRQDWVVATLKGGRTYLGYLSGGATAEEPREIYLKHVQWRDPGTGDWVGEDNLGVVLNLNNVDSLIFRHKPDPSPKLRHPKMRRYWSKLSHILHRGR